MRFVLVFLVTLSLNVQAARTIHQITESEVFLKDHRSLYLSDGEIVHFEAGNEELLEKAISAKDNFLPVEITKISHNIESADIISDIKLLPSLNAKTNDYEEISKFLDSRDPMANATLTRFATYDEAQKIMDTFNGETHDDSQCYNRAHMWTYEANLLERRNLGKIWIFFTRKYIREYDYKWWFHVSPFARVNDQMEKYVLDRGFTMIPYNVENWKNIFIKSKKECPVITDYNRYENYQEREHCYLIYSSQYYWQPYQLKNLSNGGTTQSQYFLSNLSITYRDALRSRWNGRIPRERGTDGRVEPREPAPEPRPNPRPAPSPRRDRDIRVGDQVISSNGVVGRVVRWLSNGLVEVRYTTLNYPIKQNPNDLAVTYGSVNGFSVGDWVMSSNGVRGYITGIYIDGRVSVKYDTSAAHIWQYTSSLRRLRRY